MVLLLAVACADSSGLTSELVTEADFPVSLPFAPDGRLFYNELRTGNIRVITADGGLLPQPFAHINNVAQGVEGGLIGLALDPDFATNHYLYIYSMEYVRREIPAVAQPKVLRFTDANNRGIDPTIILGDLPQTDSMQAIGAHVAGNVHFGPDGFLYITIGDMGVGEDPQSLGSLRGKILRVDKANGSAAPDNPFVGNPEADPRIWAYGFRNPFDFTFHPESGRLYPADNGPFACDKLVLVEKGENYNWTEVGPLDPFCFGRERTRPIYLYALPGKQGAEAGSNVGPTGLQFVSGDLLPLPRRLPTGLRMEHRASCALSSWAAPTRTNLLSDDIVVKDCQLDIALQPRRDHLL